MHGIQRFSKHLLAHCWQYWEISSNFIFLNACRSIPLDMLMPVFVRQFSRDSISKSSKHSKNIVSPWCLCANQQFSQECRAPISLWHTLFSLQRKLQNWQILTKLQIHSVPPVHCTFTQHNAKVSFLAAYNQNDPPHYNCDRPSLCIGGFYWQQGGLPSAAVVRGFGGGWTGRVEGGG